jgi:CHAD domain-containing protein
MGPRRDHEPGTDLAAFVAARFAGSRDAIVENHVAVLAGDVEAVHKMRVATRRLRSDLRTFDLLIDQARVVTLGFELRSLAHALGAVRDLDVLRPQVDTLVTALPAVHLDAGRALVTTLGVQRAEAHEALSRTLGGTAHVTLVSRLGALAEVPPVAPGRAASSDAEPHVRRAVRRSVKADARRARKLGTNPADADLHALRKRLKRTRYGATALAELSGRKTDRRLVTALGALQDELGAMQDLTTLATWLPSVARTDGERAAFAAGMLVPAVGVHTSRARRRWKVARAALRALADAQA